MSGHVIRRGDKVLLRVYDGRDPLSGRKRYRTKTLPAMGARAAAKELAAFVTEVTGSPAKTQRTFGKLLEDWYELRSGDWSPGTALNTRSTIDGRLKVLHGLPIEDVTVERLEEFYAALRARGGRNGGPLAPATVIRLHGIVRLALGQAVKWGWLASNPAELAEPGRADPPEITPPKAADVRRLLQAAEERDPELALFLALDAETGARRGELGALRFSDFDDEGVSIARGLVIGPDTAENRQRFAGHIWPARWSRGELHSALIEKRRPKTRGSVRTISLSPVTLELVRAQRVRLDEALLAGGGRYPVDGFVFPGRMEGDQPIRPDVWTRRFTRLRDELDLPTVRLHDLRHFVATSLLTAGVDLATVAGRLGHGGGGKTTLAIYAHFLREPDRVASDVMAALLRRPDAPAPGSDVVPLRRAVGDGARPKGRAEGRAEPPARTRVRRPRGRLTRDDVGADDGIRTRDPNLGKVVLYQLSHVRVSQGR